jgi:hypothetical protein
VLNSDWLEGSQLCSIGDSEFLSEIPSEIRKAKAMCSACPMQAACLRDHYLDTHTVIGGTSWSERRAALKTGTVPDFVAERLDKAADEGTLHSITRHLSYVDFDLYAALHARHGRGTAWS